jgi:hypothetical protein
MRFSWSLELREVASNDVDIKIEASVSACMSFIFFPYRLLLMLLLKNIEHNRL